MERVTGAEKLRLFVAFDVHPHLLDAIGEAVAPLRERWPGARWTPIANQHVTLKFLGWVVDDLVDEIHSVLREVASRHGAAQLRPGRYGAFPSQRRARVFWVGFLDPEGALENLVEDLEQALERLGFEREERRFTAHLTLARFKVPQRIEPDLTEIRPLGGALGVDRIVLYRSHLSSKGPRYEALQAFELGS